MVTPPARRVGGVSPATIKAEGSPGVGDGRGAGWGLATATVPLVVPAFLLSLGVIFVAELGDKTMLATITLG